MTMFRFFLCLILIGFSISLTSCPADGVSRKSNTIQQKKEIRRQSKSKSALPPQTTLDKKLSPQEIFKRSSPAVFHIIGVR